MSEDRFQLRASDYKSAWVTALGRDLKESAELTRVMSILSGELDGQRVALVDVIELMPQLLIAIEGRLDDAALKQTLAISIAVKDVQARIDSSATKLMQSQNNFLAEFESQRQDLVKARALIDSQRADIKRARAALNEDRADFNQMGLFRRLFIKM